MMIRILDRENDTLLNKFIAQMRDVGVQGDSMRFRRNLERTGEVMAYEISKTLHYSMRTVETPLGEAEVALPDDQIVIATILRAGLPFHQGFLNYFDDAQNAFVSAYRKYSKDGACREGGPSAPDDSRRRDRQRGGSRVCEKALFGSGYVDLVRHGRLGADGQVVHRTRAGRRGRSGLRRQNVSVRRGSPLWPPGRIPSGRRSPA